MCLKFGNLLLEREEGLGLVVLGGKELGEGLEAKYVTDCEGVILYW